MTFELIAGWVKPVPQYSTLPAFRHAITDSSCVPAHVKVCARPTLADLELLVVVVENGSFATV
jgi:hypothetical protein